MVQTTFFLTEPRLKKAVDRVFAMGFKGKGFLDLTSLNRQANSAKEALELFFKPLDKNQEFFQEAHDIVYSEILTDEMIEPFERVVPALKQLKKNHDLNLVTYGIEAVQYKKLEKAGIESSLFSNIVVTKTKDKESSYRKIFEKLGCDAKEVFVVGDRFDRDLMPAKKLGFQTVMVSWGRGQKKDYKRADFVIENINQLKDIIV